ncbi:MAG: hypothetical protein WBB37_11095 [bacterium]
MISLRDIRLRGSQVIDIHHQITGYYTENRGYVNNKKIRVWVKKLE